MSRKANLPPQKQQTSPWRKVGRGLLVLCFWLLVWQLLSLWMGRPLLLPGPLPVARRLAELIISLRFWQIAAHSLGRIVLGFVVGLLGGMLVALLTQWSKTANALISPLLKAILATPVVSFSIMLIILFRSNMVPVYIVVLIVLPVVWENFSAGIRATDGQLLEMAQTFRLGFGKKLRRIYVPSIMPYFLAACTTTLRLAWKSGIAAEVISSPPLAIGRALQDGRVYLQMADVMVWTVVVILLSLLLEWGLMKLAAKVGRRYNVQRGAGGVR